MWTPTAEYLQPFRDAVSRLQDCNAPGKPVYHSDSELSSYWRTYTGYPNSTPIPTWSEEKKVRYWRHLQRVARAKLEKAIHGPGSKKPKKRKRIGPNAAVAAAGSIHSALSAELTRIYPSWIDAKGLAAVLNLSPGQVWSAIQSVRKYSPLEMKHDIGVANGGRACVLSLFRLRPTDEKVDTPSTIQGESVVKEQANDCIGNDPQS